MTEVIKIGEYYIKEIIIETQEDVIRRVHIKKEIILTTEENEAKRYLQEEIEPLIKDIKRK